MGLFDAIRNIFGDKSEKEAEEIIEIANDPEGDDWDDQFPITPVLGQIPATGFVPVVDDVSGKANGKACGRVSASSMDAKSTDCALYIPFNSCDEHPQEAL